MFENLKGIQRGREFKPHEESVLEQLLKAGFELINNDEIKQNLLDNFLESRKSIQGLVDKLDLVYDNDLINQLIKAATYKLSESDDESKRAFGIYTGCLATRLYNENQETIIHIKDQEMDYILFGLEKANQVIIENCKGDYIGCYIGSHGCSVKSVIIKDVTGYSTGLGIGSGGGSVGSVTIEDVKGYGTGQEIGSGGGSVNSVTIKDVTGESTGYGISFYGGSVNSVVIEKVTGNSTGWYIGSHEGSVDKLIINNSTGFDKSKCNANEIIVDGEVL